MNYNRFPLFLALVNWLGFTRWLGFVIPARWVLGFAISLLLLTACDADRHERMQQELLRARKMNKEYVDFTTDSVMKEVADYYDRHGTPNERMEAHYLLGCAYRDMGEAPRAVDCYLDAVACADTTAADCDFHTLGCIYSQMAELYHRQLLLTYEIDSEKRSSHYFFLAKDTANAIFEIKMVAGAMILLNKEDSAEIILDEAISLYRKHGYLQEELQTSTMLMHIYSKKPNYIQELKRLIDRYDNECINFDSLCITHSSLRHYYYYKGRYYEEINLLDSAEYYYRMIYRPGMSFSNFDPMYSGLLSVFKKRHNADSVAKYAQLYCAINDSSISVKDKEITAQMSASYNYNRYQRLAFQNEKEAYETRFALFFLMIIMLSTFIIIYLLWRNYKEKRKRELEEQKRLQIAKQQELEKLKVEFSDVMERYHRNRKAMQLLEKSHQEAISLVQERLESAQQTIEEINQKYEESLALFNNENETLKEKIEELSSQKSISMLMDKNMLFAKEPIVRRMLELADNPKLRISKREWEDYISAISDYYPEMLKDLKGNPNLTTQEIYTVLLVLLNMRTDDIARLINVSGQRVTNIKSEINYTLFGVKSARPLYENIINRYSIYLFE